MKTFFERLFIHFDFMSNPAEGSTGKKTGQRKKKVKKSAIQGIESPESVYLRNPYKGADSARYTPAP